MPSSPDRCGWLPWPALAATLSVPARSCPDPSEPVSPAVVALANSGAISEENHIDLAAFGSLCAAPVVLDLQRAVGRNVRMAPGGWVIAMAADRHSDTHLALVHGGPFCGSI